MKQYAAVLLPGWVQFDLTEPIAAPLDEAVPVMLADVPKDAARRLHKHVRQQLFELLTRLAAAGSTAVFMPLENPAVSHAFPVFSVRPADFVIEGNPVDPMEYLIGLVGSGLGSIIEPEGMVGVRRVVDHDTTRALADAYAGLPADDTDDEAARAAADAIQQGRLSREIEYILGVPQTDDQWMAVTASISVMRGDGSDELLASVTEFADRWVETIRWSEEAAHV